MNFKILKSIGIFSSTLILVGGILFAPPPAPAQYEPFAIWTELTSPLINEYNNLLPGANMVNPAWDGQTSSLCQVLFTGGNGEIDLPDIDGNPTIDDTVSRIIYVGTGIPWEWDVSGLFVYNYDRPPTNDIYIRAFNAPTLSEASFYGDCTYYFIAGSDDEMRVNRYGLHKTDQPLDPADDDGDGANNSWEKSLKTYPDNPDSDGDGLLDGEELLGHTLPANRSDLSWPDVGDITFNVAEPGIPVTNPHAADTDGDTFTDFTEVVNLGSDPTDPNDPHFITPTPSPSPTPSATPSSTPSVIPTATPAPTASPSVTPTTTPSVTPTPSPMPTAFYLVLATGDYNGDGAAEIAVYRPSSSLWLIRGLTQAYFGQAGDQPAPGDYLGDGTTRIAVFRPDSSLWVIRGHTRVYFGGGDDLSAVGDYDGDGCSDIALFRPETGLWAARGISRVYYGREGDALIPFDIYGDGTSRAAIYREKSNLWALRGFSRFYFGRDGDAAAIADYDGDGTPDPAVFRQDNGLWVVKGSTRYYFGRVYDQGVPADFNGGGAGIGIFRESNGLWAVRNTTRAYWGEQGDLPLAR